MTLIGMAILLIPLMTPPGLASETGTATASAKSASQPAAPASTWMKITGGCLGGGLVGSVVPVIGNIIGCAAGGLTTWWWGKRKTAAAPSAMSSPPTATNPS